MTHADAVEGPGSPPPPVDPPEAAAAPADAPASPADGPAAPPDGPAGAAEAAVLEAHLRRALADLDNLRKRYDREVDRERATERARAAALWLPIVDDLERALEHAGADADSIVEGVRTVRDQALATLEHLGYRRFDDLGELFDPQRDEAVRAIDVDAPPGTVVATLRPGYGAGETILRPASVVVSRGPG